ncbi:17724_t:CDS:1, partial [Racocetra persica]
IRVRKWIYLKLPNQQEDTIELENHKVNLLLRIFIESGAVLSGSELNYFNVFDQCIEIKPEQR